MIAFQWFHKWRVKFFLLLLYLLFFLSDLSAQSSIGLNINLNKDIYQLRDERSEISKTPRINISAGMVYRYMFKKGTVINTGFQLKHYKESMRFNRYTSYATSTGAMAVELPLVFGQRVALSKEMGLYVMPMLGCVVNYLPGYGEWQNSSGGKMKNLTDSLSYYSVGESAKEFLVTATMGIMVEYAILSRLSMGFEIKYNQGFEPMTNEYINYRLNSDPTSSAIQTNYGSYWTLWSMKLFYNFKKRDKNKDQEK